MSPETDQNLFEPTVDSQLLHPSFQTIATGPNHAAARALMQLTFSQWSGADGQFVREFQTRGFDARVWELYLSATLNSLGWKLSCEGGRPDFKCERNDQVVFVEAGTANASGNPLPPTTTEAFFDRLRVSTDNRDEVAVRFGSILRSKVEKRYENLEHVAGRPLVIAVQGFFDAGSLFHNELPLVRYLYDQALTVVDDDGRVSLRPGSVGHHHGDSKSVESGLFTEADAEHISAVLWSNSGTVAKFNRQALLAGLGRDDWEIHRYGTELDPRQGATERAIFIERVGMQPEPWEEGLVLMHNPNAKMPLPDSAFPEATQVRLDGGSLEIDCRGRKIFSQTSMPHPTAYRAWALQIIRKSLGFVAGSEPPI